MFEIRTRTQELSNNQLKVTSVVQCYTFQTYPDRIARTGETNPISQRHKHIYCFINIIFPVLDSTTTTTTAPPAAVNSISSWEQYGAFPYRKLIIILFILRSVVAPSIFNVHAVVYNQHDT